MARARRQVVQRLTQLLRIHLVQAMLVDVEHAVEALHGLAVGLRKAHRAAVRHHLLPIGVTVFTVVALL